MVELLPDLAEAYSRKISSPMDFRTIEEERLVRYRSIREFQKDLLLTFENCKLFNGEENEYGELAK